MLELVVTDPPADISQLSERLRHMVEALNAGGYDFVRAGTINLKLVDDATMAEFNKQYSGQVHPTDVLSFSYIEDGETEEGELGDMIINLEAAHRQAEAAAIELAEEIATLALHGILHILGHDHSNADDRARMDRLQADTLMTAHINYRDFHWQD